MRISDWSSDVCSSDLALRGERIDIGRPGQTDRIGPRLRALLKREAEPDRGLARCACDQDLTRPILALLLELVGDQPADQEQWSEHRPIVMVRGAIALQDRKRTRLNTNHSCAYQ